MVTAVGPVQDEMSARLYVALKCIEHLSAQIAVLSEGVAYESQRTSEIQRQLGAREECYTKQHAVQQLRCAGVDAVAKQVGSKAAKTSEIVKTIHQAQMASPAGTAEQECRRVFEPRLPSPMTQTGPISPMPQTDPMPHQ